MPLLHQLHPSPPSLYRRLCLGLGRCSSQCECVPRPHAGKRVLWLRYTSLPLPRLLLPTPPPSSSPSPTLLSFLSFALFSLHSVQNTRHTARKKHGKNLVTLHNLLNTNGSPASRNSSAASLTHSTASPLPPLSALFPLITRTNFGCSLCCTHSSSRHVSAVPCAFALFWLFSLVFHFGFSFARFGFSFSLFILFFFDFLFASGRACR